MSALSTGTAIAWTAQISPDLLDGVLGFKLNEDELGWVGSLMSLGAACFCLFTGILSDLCGRKMLMLYLIAPMVGGWFLLIFAENVAMLYAGRFLTGNLLLVYYKIKKFNVSIKHFRKLFNQSQG